MFKLVCFALVACAAATAPVISLDMDESMSLHKEKHTLAKGMNQDWVERCDAKSKPSQCPFPKARAYDSHDKAVTVTTTMWVMDIENKPQGCDRRGKNCKGKQVTKVDYNKRSTYVFKYDAKDEANNHASQVVFVLELNDVHYPELTVCGQPIQYVEGARPFHFCESKATDNVGVGAITYKMKSTTGVPVFDNKSFKEARDYIKRMVYNPRFLGKYVIYMTVNDNAGIYRKNPTDSITRGNQVIKTRGLVIRDTQKPWITITKKLKPLECAGTKKCAERSITKPFYYFNSGSAKGCEHRHHYLYEYRGSDCVWTSKPTALEALGKYTYEWMRVEFKVADYGKMEYSDYVYVEMAPCLDGKCERWYGTELIRGDTKGNLGRRSIHDPYHGWYWQTLKQAKGGRSGNWMYQLDKHHNQVRIRITLKSNSDYSERHILDNLEIKGWGCDAGFSDPGAVLHDHYWSKPWNTKKATATENTVDVTKIGTYIVRYNGKDVANHKAVEQTRNVFVRDTLAPKITLKGAAVEHHWSQDKWTDRGVSTSDQCDKNLPSVKTWWGGVSNRFDQKALGTHVRYYKVCDHVNRCSTVTRKIVIADNKVPMLNLVGGSAVKSVAKRGAKYVDAGAKCSDFVDGALHHAITSSITFKGKKVTSVDRATVGKYTITYKCKDLSGNNAANVVRVVTVVDKQCPKMTLKGKGLISLEAGVSTYTEPGFTATDDIDGNLVTDVKTAITFNGKKLATGCGEKSITAPFHYFNTGSAKGCEHRHHYLYEYRGSDCIWTSSPTALKELGKYTYESMRVEFKVADYGKMEYSDYVKVELAPCLNGKCESFYQTELIRADTKGNLGRRSINDRYHGWYWQTVRQAKGSAANWMDQLDKHHNQIRIRITLKSDDNYNERHILDNLEIKGMACDKVVTTKYPTAYPTKNPTANPTGYPTSYPTGYPTAFPTSFPTGYPTAFPTAYPTGYPTAFPTSFPTSYPTPQCSTTCSWVKNHHIQVTHDRTLIAHNKKYNGAHYAQHKCYHDGTNCHCECHGTNWVGHAKDAAPTVKWVLDHRTPRGAQSCDTVCADIKQTCDQSSLDKLNNNDAAFAAAFESWKPGHCKKWHTGCARGNNCARWGSPFIHSSHLKDNLCWKGSPVAACGQRPVDGHHRRLCPCSSGSGKKSDGYTTAKTTLANCKNTKIAGTFSKFNTGSATGCEHRTHYLYEYRGTDCVWTSNYNKFTHPHNFDGAMIKFQMAEYGSLESDDHVLIELRFCGKGKNYGKTSGWGNYDCTEFKPTVKIANDLLGWVWTTVTGANRDAFFTARFGRYRVTSSNWRNYKLNMEPHQQWVQIRITLKSDDNYRERHILDNMEVWGGCQ